MNEDRILYLIALPIILLLVFLEYWYKKNKSQTSLLNLSSNLLCGLIDRLFFLFFGVLQFEIMMWISSFSIVEPIKNKIGYFLILFLIVDLTWYLYHRTAHKIKVFWAFHITHHQTDDFNFSLGLRVSFLQQIVRSFFWLPIALLGFEPISILIIIFLQSFYQFFLHTEIFDFPNIFRKILVTPKFHQLHHSNQIKHLDKNFGGVLILWDKIFGTYKSPYEEKSIDFVMEKNLSILSPVNAYFSPFIKLISNKSEIILKSNETKSTSFLGRLLFITFIILFIPTLVLILNSNNIGFWSTLTISTVIIFISFLISHLLLKKFQ